MWIHEQDALRMVKQRVREAERAAAQARDVRLARASRPGVRVRHAQFGIGTVMSVEPGLDDAKVVVRFNSVGLKKLMARFARLEPA